MWSSPPTKRWEDRAERAFASMANALPFIRERFTTHKAYGKSLAEILGDRMRVARELAQTHWNRWSS